MSTNKQHTEFLQLLNRYQGIVLRVCVLYTDRTPDNIDNLYQDIVGNLWEGFSRFRGISGAGTWVYRVALKTASMHWRSRHRMPRYVELDAGMCESIADTGGDELVERLYRLIDRLDSDEKTLIILYLDKVPLREIAQIIGITENAVKHRISRLKVKLKKMNEDEEE